MAAKYYERATQLDPTERTAGRLDNVESTSQSVADTGTLMSLFHVLVSL